MIDEKALVDREAQIAGYTESLLDAIQRGTRVFQFDKQWLKEEFGSLTKGLEFCHAVLVRMAVEMKDKYTIQTAYENCHRFEVYWQASEEKLQERGTAPW